MSKLESEKISEGINLHTVKTDKFKTSLINIYLQRPLNAEEVTYNSLLPMVLQRGTERYKTFKEISKELEYLYGAQLFGNIRKKGERHILEFSLKTADTSYVEDKNMQKEAISLLNNIINKPLVEVKGFKDAFVQQEKANLSNRIKGRLNDKMQYSLERLVEEMCVKEGYRLHEYGREEDLVGINQDNLYTHYNKVMKDSPIDIVVVGNHNHNNIKNVILENIGFGEITPATLNDSQMLEAPASPRKVVDEMEINQAKLSMGYRVDIPYSDPLYPAMILYTNILGGGAHSKLFLKVREEKSLCYYIFAKLEKFKSLLMISCGIEADKYDITTEVIAQQLDEMRKGNITEEEMRNAKRAIENSVRAMGDNSGALAEFYYSQIISEPFYEIDELLIKIEKVTTEDLMAVAEKVNLDTIYFLKSRK